MSFNHLNVPEHWQRYWTKYPQGMTILESLYEWVSQVDSMVDNVNDWNTYLLKFVGQFDKELQKEVVSVLKEWHDSGFLQVVIDEALQTQIDDVQLELSNEIVKRKETTTYVEDFPRLNGETTDAHRINRALKTITSGTLEFANKTYLIDEPIYIDHRRLTIRGTSKAATLRATKGNVIFYSKSLERENYRNMSLLNLVIENLTLQGVSKTGVGFMFTGIARGSSFRELYFENLERIGSISGSWSFDFSNNFATLCSNGIVFGDPLIGAHNSFSVVNALSVKNNYFTEIKNATNSAIAVRFIEGYTVKFEENTVELSDRGIVVEKASNVIITENHLEYMRMWASSTPNSHAIELGVNGGAIDGWTLEHNYFMDCSILLQNVKQGLVQQNTYGGTVGRPFVVAYQSSVIENKFIFDRGDRLNTSKQGSSTYGVFDTLSNIVSSVEQSTIKDLPIKSDWALFEEATRGGLKYFKDENGVAHIFGTVSGGTVGTGTPVATLPMYYRPRYLQFFSGSTTSGEHVAVSISSTSGDIVVRTATTSPVIINLQYSAQPN